MLTVFVGWLEPLQVFCLFLGSLHDTVKRVLGWSHWESFFSKTRFVVLAFVVLFVHRVWLYHLLDLVCHLRIIASWIDHWKSDHRSLFLLTNVEILVLFTEICII